MIHFKIQQANNTPIVQGFNNLQKNTMRLKEEIEHYISIMEVIKRVNPTTIELKHINTCRMNLKVIFLSDIVNVDRNTIISSYSHKQIHQRTQLWSNIPIPPKKAWNV